MILEEVQSLYFKYEDERHNFLQETQLFFLQRKFQPYVWFDEHHRLRIKYKYRRGINNLQELEKERNKFYEITKNFVEKQNLTIRFVHDLSETDCFLPEDVQKQWSTEFIIQV